MKGMIFSALLLCVTGCVLAMDKIETNDDATLDILNLADTEGRDISIELLISDYLDAQKTLNKEQVEQLKKHLAALSVEEYNQKVIVGLGIIKGKKNKKKTELVGALFAIVDQLKEQNKNMASSGELAQEVHRVNIRNHRMGVVGAVVTAFISICFNIWQAAD